MVHYSGINFYLYTFIYLYLYYFEQRLSLDCCVSVYYTGRTCTKSNVSYTNSIVLDLVFPKRIAGQRVIAA